jgi:hypothetical protein
VYPETSKVSNELMVPGSVAEHPCLMFGTQLDRRHGRSGTLIGKGGWCHQKGDLVRLGDEWQRFESDPRSVIDRHDPSMSKSVMLS